MLNETAMSVAIPKLMSALAVDANAAQWLTTAFLLTMAVVIPVTGFLLQRFNTRPIFLLAMTLFTTGTAHRGDVAQSGDADLRPRRPGLGHGDHDAAADDHRDDPRCARTSAAR